MAEINASELLLTRRRFLLGAGAAATSAVAFAYGCKGASEPSGQSSQEADVKTGEDSALSPDIPTIKTHYGEVAVLSVAEDCVITTDDCSFMKSPAKAIKQTAQAHLPYGTLIWADDDEVAACLLPCDTSKPLAQIGLLSLDTGNLEVAIKNAVGESDGFEIYDVRANSNGAVWVEANILDGKWRIYTAKSAAQGSSLGKASLASEGGSEWETPSLAVCGKYAFWQLSPSPEQQAAPAPAGSDSTSSAGFASTDPAEIPETSLLMRAKFGSKKEDVKVVFEAPGKMACAPTSTEKGVVIAPKADLVEGSGTYYQLTNINASSGTVTSALALPASMKPTYVAYGPTGFSFAFESIYNYGDGISNLGTYTAVSMDAANASKSKDDEAPKEGEANSKDDEASGKTGEGSDDGHSFGEWFRFPRSPFTAPAWIGNWFVIKSTSVVAGVDLASRRYFSIDPEHAIQGYGEYLATAGPSDRLVTYSNIDYTPVGGKHIYECNVRIWKAV